MLKVYKFGLFMLGKTLCITTTISVFFFLVNKVYLKYEWQLF